MLFYLRESKSKLAAYTKKRLSVCAWFLASALSITSGAAAYGSDAASPSDPAVCARMGDAMLKTANTPYTSMSTIALDKPQSNEQGGHATPRSSQTIFTGDAVFVRAGAGPWRKIDLAIRALQALVRKASTRFADCRDLGGGQLGGSPVMVFSAYEGNAPSAYGTRTKLWVDKAGGVLVRSETETTSDDGSRHSIIDYKYGSVTAPQL